MTGSARVTRASRAALPCIAVLALAGASLHASAAGAAPAPDVAFSWNVVHSGTESSFRGLDAVSADVAWVSSDTGEVLRTVDGGSTFEDVSPPAGASDGLSFGDVEANSADRALVLAVGVGEASRIYRTDDGGATWTETFRAADPSSLFDCMAMSSRKNGLALGDPVDGKFQIIATSDGGRSWDYTPADGMPNAVTEEFAWALSGSCLTAAGDNAWFGTGGYTTPRVFRSADGGMTWEVSETPLYADPFYGGGIFALDFRNARIGIAVGGDFSPDTDEHVIARTTDGGVTWALILESYMLRSYLTGTAWYADKQGDQRSTISPRQKVAFAVGPAGSHVSTDRGKTWESFDDSWFHSVDCVQRSEVCWASGEDGRVAKLVVGD